MKYLSIDIETLGLDKENNDIVEFGAVFDDLTNQEPIEKLPRFQSYIYQEDDRYSGSMYAMAMHGEIFKKIANKDKNKDKNRIDGSIQVGHMLSLRNLPHFFKNWLADIDWPSEKGVFRLNVAGKNFGSFDKPFLDAKGVVWNSFDYTIKWPHRFMDPTMLYFDHKIDEELPNLQKCLDRAGIAETVDHTTIGDAMNIVRLLRKKYS